MGIRRRVGLIVETPSSTADGRMGLCLDAGVQTPPFVREVGARE